MLIEFKVSNFLSIRDEQTLSLVANSSKELPSRVIERELPGISKLKFLKGAAIYGANASGKTNVLEAIWFLAEFVKTSATELRPGDATGARPFKLDRASVSEPSRFEITFVAEGVRYLFGLALTPKRVVEEYLAAYPKGIAQRWYHREYDEASNSYTWTKPSGAFKHDQALEGKIRENALFLSVGPQFNHPQLTGVFNWFKENLRFINLAGGGREMSLSPSLQALEEPQYRDRILSLLKSADIGIEDAQVEEKEISPETMKSHLPPVIFSQLEKERGQKALKVKDIRLLHQVEGSEPVAFDFNEEESAGTRRFFSLVGPWLDTLDNGYTVFIDEIENCLHPLLVKELLELMFGEENTSGAQVIFTAHNPILLDNQLLRRDQIWFTEKTPAGTTCLYPLTDYQPRSGEALTKGYLAGRYGGVPYLPEGLLL